ncbi:hypothetical protein M409DRAFT_23367 [Zasmidium cellare ATCC 36951]|uniref:Uncharacterized protein n=1 Tax=Zasmidium cellare ATCC 36951 TaxID=1080233 RepID=A0A6A6CJ18_ZASCE|nr:uncharacterized protein M409DRAFT_23367 [Zasmidium cellare ATCC 36951]KAF2166178.1 hypothetical protein M409DRAFT_23367 [Zasmidium cellare ATCC 36951]
MASSRPSTSSSVHDETTSFGFDSHDCNLSTVGDGTHRLKLLPPSLQSTSDAHHSGDPNLQPLGIPHRKPYLGIPDISALAISTVCCISAIFAVEHNNLAWHLGTTNQLIVSGFLLSVMNLCLGKCTTFIFVLVEARFGRSKLQNYDNILRNEVLGPRLDFVWRTTLACFMALPIGLSVAYKTFTGGSSSHLVNTTAIIGMPPEYGLFNVPNSFQGDIGRYFNASLPLLSASSLVDSGNGTQTEPPFSESYPHYYGANMLLLNDTSVALLDLPRDGRLTELQNSLKIGESLLLEADVHGSVATQREPRPSEDPDFHEACLDKKMAVATAPMNDGDAVFLLASLSTSDNSRVWFGFAPGGLPKCSDYGPYGNRYDIRRHACHGVWSITRAGIELSSGSCDSDELPKLNQYIFTSNTFWLGDTFVQTLMENVGKFSNFTGPRNESLWKNPSMTAAMAGIVWSKAVGLPGMRFNDTPATLNGQVGWGCCNITLGDNGLLYEIPNEIAIVIRPTLKRNWLLYLVFAVQPILMAALMAGSIILHSVPLGQGFGMISILAGMYRNRDQLEVFRGASLSGELREDVRIGFLPRHSSVKDQHCSIECQIGRSRDQLPVGKIRPGVKYS